MRLDITLKEKYLEEDLVKLKVCPGCNDTIIEYHVVCCEQCQLDNRECEILQQKEDDVAD